MIAFTQTDHCHSRAHCHTCRDKEGGRQWRAALRKCFRVDEIDFECPHDVPWGITSPVASILSERQKRCGIGEDATGCCEELSDDEVYCELAIDLTGKPCQRAGRMRAFLRKPESECPRGTWGPEMKAIDDGETV